MSIHSFSRAALGLALIAALCSACAGLPPPRLAGTGSEPIVLELRPVGRNWFGVDIEVEGRSMTAVLDTGCKDALALPPGRTADWGLPSRPAFRGNLWAGGLDSPGTSCAMVRLSLGGREVGSFPVANGAVKWHSLIGEGKAVIGDPLLRLYNCLIDVPGGRLVLFSRGKAEADLEGLGMGGCPSLPFERDPYGVIVKVDIAAGKRIESGLRMIFDTGAGGRMGDGEPTNTLNPHSPKVRRALAAAREGWSSEHGGLRVTAYEGVELRAPGAGEASGYGASLGGQREVTVSSISPLFRADGLLGLGFMSRNLIYMDNDAGALRFIPAGR